VTNFCDDLRNLHIIDDYSNSPSGRGPGNAKAEDGRPRIKRRSASLLRTLQKQQRMAQSGDQDDEVDPCYGKEEEEEEDEWTLCEIEEGAKSENHQSGAAGSNKHPHHGGYSDSQHGDHSNPQRSLNNYHVDHHYHQYRTPEEAAWELRNEVVTLELKNSTGAPPFSLLFSSRKERTVTERG
jgi:hypothetical protein